MILASAILFSSLGLTALRAESDDKPRLVVMDLGGRQGVTADEAGFVSELIRTGMVKTDLFVVVDRQSISKVLQEQALHQSGACSDTSCTVKIGQLLAANKMMTGSVIKIGTRISVNVNIIDVEKASIDFADSQSADSIERVDDAAQQLSERIAVKVTGKQISRGFVARVWDGADGSSLWRSALVPGWGQWNRGETIKSGSILGATLLGLALVSTSYSQYQSAEKNYKSTSNLVMLIPGDRESIGLTFLNLAQSGAAREKQNKAAAQGQVAIGFVALVYLYNLFDATFLGGAPDAKKTAGSDIPAWRIGFAATSRRDFQAGVTFAF